MRTKMTVYELIQNLAKCNPNGLITVEIEMDTVDTLECVSEDSADGKDKTLFAGIVDSVEQLKNKQVIVKVYGY